MIRRVITPGIGTSRPLPSLAGANRKHHSEGSVNGIGKADQASVLGALLRRHGLTAEGGNLAQRGSALVHVVRDVDGRRLVIKEGGRRYGGNEQAWLSTHASHPGVVDVLDQFGGLLLLRWVPGPVLAELPLGAGHYARPAGELLASLQRAPDPAAASLSRRIIAAGRHLPYSATAEIQHCHERLTAALAARAASDRRDWTYLHADFHPRNLILSLDGPVTIDPFGLAGPPAWDLAQFAAIAYGGAQLDAPPPLSHDAILTQLVVGFGRTPPLLEEMAAYWLILVQRMRQRLGAARAPGSTASRTSIRGASPANDSAPPAAPDRMERSGGPEDVDSSSSRAGTSERPGGSSHSRKGGATTGPRALPRLPQEGVARVREALASRRERRPRGV